MNSVNQFLVYSKKVIIIILAKINFFNLLIIFNLLFLASAENFKKYSNTSLPYLVLCANACKYCCIVPFSIY